MNEFKADNSVKRVFNNSIYAVLRFGVYTLFGVLFIPFLVKQYGAGRYGLIALAGFLTQYVGMISGCVGSAVGRYINVALNQDDWKQANEIFSTAVLANVCLILIQLPIYAFLVWKLEWLISFPPEVAVDFRILVICNIAIFLFSTLTGVVSSPIAAANRVDLFAKIDVFRQGFRVLLLTVMVLLIGAKLWVVGVVELGMTLLFGSVSLMIARRLAYKLVFRFDALTMKWIKPVLTMAGWSLVSMIGFSLFIKTDIWMINRFVSKEMAGVYAAMLVWPNFIKQIGSMFGDLLGPVFTIDFAKGDLERMKKACLLGSQVLSYGAAYGCGIFVIGASGLIRLWLGDTSYVHYVPWVQLLVGQLTFTISGSVVWRIFVTIGKTKYMGIGNLIPGLVNILLSLFLVYAGFGAFGVLWGTIVAVTFKENLLFPLWVSRETGIPYRSFLAIYLRSGIVFGLVVGIGYLFGVLGSEFSLLEFIFAALISFLATLATIYYMTKRDSRDEIYRFVLSIFYKRSFTP